jgi:hypothetical protein
MQLTVNVSLFRLTLATIDSVVAERADHAGLGLAELELLPHLNRLEAPFLERVRRYSEVVSTDIVALADGAALLVAEGDTRHSGEVVVFRGGVQSRPRSTGIEV